jgi:hypothetical protein
VSIANEVGAFLSGAEGALQAATEIAQFFGESSCDQAAQAVLIKDLLVLEGANRDIRFCLDGAGLQLMRNVSSSERDILIIRRGALGLGGTHGIPYQVQAVDTTRGPVLIMRRRRSPRDVLTSPELISSIKAEMNAQGRPVLLVLGPARKKIFTDGKPYSPTSAKDVPGSRERNELYLLMRLVLEGAIAEFFEAQVQPAIAEGGWSGVIEGEFGAPLLGYQLAIAHDLVVFQIMPKDGEYNRNQQPTVHRIAGLAWGDDSPTLIAIGDAAIVFQPAGAWTDVEVDNLGASDKPIAFVWTDGNIGSDKRRSLYEAHFPMFRGARAERDEAFRLGRQVGRYLVDMLSRRAPLSAPPLSRNARDQLGSALAAKN